MRARRLAAAAVWASLLAGCADGVPAEREPSEPTVDGAASSAASPGGDVEAGEGVRTETVAVQGFRFEPDLAEVAAGATVTWTNEDAVGHTVTAGTPEAPGNAFDLALPDQGAQVSHTFTSPGRYAYFCELHPSMLGQVVVR